MEDGRGRKRGCSTVVGNSVVRDCRLSLDARCLFAVVQSLPADWEFSVKGLAGYLGLGRGRVGKLVSELEGCGYVTRSYRRDRGRFAPHPVWRIEACPKTSPQVCPLGGDGQTFVSNSALRDGRIGLGARGLLLLMLGLPDGWEFSIRGLVAISNRTSARPARGRGRTAIAGYLAELERYGYISRTRARRSDGTFAGTVYAIGGSARPSHRVHRRTLGSDDETQFEKLCRRSLRPVAGKELKSARKEYSRRISEGLSTAAIANAYEVYRAEYVEANSSSVLRARFATPLSRWLAEGGGLDYVLDRESRCGSVPGDAELEKCLMDTWPEYRSLRLERDALACEYEMRMLEERDDARSRGNRGAGYGYGEFRRLEASGALAGFESDALDALGRKVADATSRLQQMLESRRAVLVERAMAARTRANHMDMEKGAAA